MIVVNSSIGSDANLGSGSSSANGGPEIRSAPYTGPVIKAPEGKYYTEFDKNVAGIGRTVIDVLTKPMITGLKVASDPTFPVCLTGLEFGVPLASTGTPPTVAAGIGTIVVSCGPAVSKAFGPGPSPGEAFEKAYLDLSAKSYSEQNSPNANTLNKDLGGINFTSIKLNYISVSTDQEGGVNFDIILKAQKANGSSPGIDPINSTVIGATAFMTGLAIPSDKFWVNLNPWEPDRIIEEELSQSEVGRIMLEADLQMKKDFSNYINPCNNEMSNDLWNNLDNKREILVQRCMSKYPGEIQNKNNVNFRPATRLWITPDKIFTYSNDSQIYIINATLTIQSEADANHSSFVIYNQNVRTLSKGCLEELNKSSKEYGEYFKERVDHTVLPSVIADVNYGDKYENLREIYVALALAQWYKLNINPSNDVFQNIYSSDFTAPKALNPWSPYKIWDDYVYSFENGEFKCLVNTTAETSNGTIIRSRLYSYGGVEFNSIKNNIINIKGMPPVVEDQIERAVTQGFIDDGDSVLFAISLHMDRTQDISTSSSGLGLIPSTNVYDYSNNSINKQDTVIDFNEDAGHVTCPEGWMGPDEKGECWKLQILS
jgi:hypothetical protein